MNTAWGNPGSKTFRKRCIRQVRMSTCTVLVHSGIADLAAQILRSAEDNGTQLPETLGGWVPFTSGVDPREFGLAFEAPEGVSHHDWPGWHGYREPDSDTHYLVYDGTPEDALATSAFSETERVSVLNPQLPKSPDAWQTSLPGARPLQAGKKGDDVQFIQYALGCLNTDGIYDLHTTEAVMALQSRFGLRQTGVMDEDAWNALLPTARNFMIEYGNTGPIVRLLQAALLAYDWDDDVHVTGRFDQVTLRGVKHLQDTYGLRASGTMAGAEWAALLGRPVRNA